MRQFKIGLIGLGGMAGAHIRWMKEQGGFTIVAVSDVSPEALERTGAKLELGPEKQYADFRDLTQDTDVEAIVAVTPNQVHAAVIQACLEAGKPFLAEKPFTRSFEEARPLLELYERKPVPAMLGFSYRYTPAFRYAKELLLEGRLGKIRSFSSQYLQGWGSALYDGYYTWRYNKAVTGTGALGDLGSHMIDMARYLFGEFEQLSAQLHTFIPERRHPSGGMAQVDVDDFASFQAQLAGGVVGVFQTSRNAIGSGNQHEIAIYGDAGTLHASTVDPDHLVWIREESPGQLAKSVIDVPQRCKRTQYGDFASLLAGEQPEGLPGFMDGYRNQQVLDAIVRSSEGGTAIRLQP
ncbi:Gfo/Idh/MocA family protein [Paenibacillus protaetiae]|uniref:Gfo/Idh/MocA family oxidoreductase n=1 Tax=Paenibacillus protaetiae TaxID=2509456 RepID=A0A4P6EYL0_9BACL|nr:Gfo/Idh/MocA family oxidoreductase [Paenibacillus protaetiae]QAY67936.1 Gfo/Idh/MocA family oxidoreductase [Paenibacillus protaetiae]